MKAYTDLEQSKKLAEILPLESADMDYIPIINIDGEYSVEVNEWDNEHIIDEGWIPCWSLAALLEAVDFITINLHYNDVSRNWITSATIHDSTKHCTKYESAVAVNPIDACYEMIIKLHEQNLLRL